MATASPTKPMSLTASLILARGMMVGVMKRGKNPAFKSEYVTLDDLMDVVIPALLANGILLTHTMEPQSDGSSILVTTLRHDATEEQMVTSWRIAAGNPQQVGSAITYGRRYCVSAILALSVDVDDDGNAASGAPPAPMTRPAPAPRIVAPTPAPKPVEPPVPKAPTPGARLRVAFDAHQIAQDSRAGYAAEVMGREVAARELTHADVDRIIDKMGRDAGVPEGGAS